MAKQASQSMEMLITRFQPGDIAFLQARTMLSKDQMTALHHQFKKLLPEVKCVILNGSVRVQRGTMDGTESE